MVIHINKKPKAKTADDFISGAPDANAKPAPSDASMSWVQIGQDISTAAEDEVYSKGVAKGHKRQISLTIAPHLLKRVDEVAKKTGQTRAGIINLAVSRALDGDFFK